MARFRETISDVYLLYLGGLADIWKGDFYRKFSGHACLLKATTIIMVLIPSQPP
jgi:hypothetical protein